MYYHPSSYSCRQEYDWTYPSVDPYKECLEWCKNIGGFYEHECKVHCEPFAPSAYTATPFYSYVPERAEQPPQVERNRDRLELHPRFSTIQQLRDAIVSELSSQGAYDIAITTNPWGGTPDPAPGYPYPLAITGKEPPYGQCQFWIYHEHIAGREYAEHVVATCNQPYISPRSTVSDIVNILRWHTSLGRGRTPWPE
ncbi:hypothetical protein [Bacillus paralicheniformis]|uniref:hypothetical protein n=1 Tax=Bacillus paralicheniformis TaxID=1648923 RepID=UPI00128B30ED|nr:hypothetical protein [Bacillus paralicheniformis]MPQ27208.1 hypothetical protein [Bacillus paralicheniformis]